VTSDSSAFPSPPDEVVATKAGVDGEKSTENGDFMIFYVVFFLIGRNWKNGF
jgi:hypothetical protein